MQHPIADMAYGQDEVYKIAAVECAVHVALQAGELGIRGSAHEIGGRIVHIVHHAVRALDDRLAVAPRYRRSQKARHLAVVARGEGMGHAYGIGLDEVGVVVFVVEVFEQRGQLSAVELRVRFCHRSSIFFCRPSRPGFHRGLL